MSRRYILAKENFMGHKIKSYTIIFLITLAIIILSIIGVVLEQGSKIKL